MTDTVGIIAWDWRQQPDLDRLADIIAAVSGGTLHLSQVDTGSDEYAIVVAPVALAKPAARQVYERWCDADGSNGDLLNLTEGSRP